MAAITARAAVFLAAAACGACTQRAAPAATVTGVTDRGAKIFSGSCTACHQNDGRGIPNVYPSLSASPIVTGDPAALARWVIKGERPPSMPAGRYASIMPQFGWLNDADAAALLTHVRANFGNHAGAVDAAAVAHALGRP